MEGLPMSDSFSVKSSVRGEYHVHFVENLLNQVMLVASKPNIIFIIDRKIPELFPNEFYQGNTGERCIIVDAKEENKTVEYAQEIIRKLINKNVRKNDILVAIGGGITQDLVAFISSILFRGVEWMFFPTTLLAQCDSCIGSKSSINFDQFKNLLGTFNPPSEIYIYPGFLESLSESEIRSGIGEMMHYFFTEGIALARQVSDRFDLLLKDRSDLTYFIANSLRIKKVIIELDEFDRSIRHIFNYGHTFGHAIEAITHYAIPHGQAVSLGMDLANYISFSRKMINEEQFNEMHEILKKNMPSFAFTEKNIDDYFTALSRDKKNKG
jgi:3-dehydroquinate synthase